ncbi:uncharacterized protein LOC143287696 [Babylonia areolata]|uniref:uncharacterized protein LOC143287696 n=1 Tax=Babylonia areolata TaxID=304850 RepID=UPI003FD61AC8
MRNGGHRPRDRWSWRSSRSSSMVALVSWVALLSMFSSVFLSILWEIYTQPPKAKDADNLTYSYPVYTLNFEEALEERKILAEEYGYTLSDLKVERRSELSLEEFWDLYDAKWPVLVTDVVPQWPAYKKWTKEYLNKTYGFERVVMKAVMGTMHNAEGLSLPLFIFVNHAQESNPNYWTYLVDELFITTRPELLKHVPDTEYTQEDFFQQFPKEVRPWHCMLLWGTAHSRSELHIDPYNWTGTNAVLWGTKKWKLFPPGQDHLLYVYPNISCGFPLECNKYNSPVDTYASDMEAEKRTYPLFSSAKYIEVTQKAGELLIIPTGWFHQAYNSEETLAVSGQFMNRNNYRFVLEEILKAGNLQRKQLPTGFHNLMPPDQVSILMSMLPKKILKNGRERTEDYLHQIQYGMNKGN